jgi:hypothetical protein
MRLMQRLSFILLVSSFLAACGHVDVQPVSATPERPNGGGDHGGGAM